MIPKGRGARPQPLSPSLGAFSAPEVPVSIVEVRGQQEVDTWPPPVLAEEAQQPEMAAVLNAERLEVSVDGLTLSPDPEERPGAEGAPLLPPPLPPPSPPGSGRGPGVAGEQPEPGEAAAGGAAEEARRLEQRWGFGLEELYGLSLRFFKGEPAPPRRPCRIPGARPGPWSPGGLDQVSPSPTRTGPRPPEQRSVLGVPKFVTTRLAPGSHP